MSCAVASFQRLANLRLRQCRDGLTSLPGAAFGCAQGAGCLTRRASRKRVDEPVDRGWTPRSTGPGSTRGHSLHDSQIKADARWPVLLDVVPCGLEGTREVAALDEPGNLFVPRNNGGVAGVGKW